jgi:5-enolpyruvylshikimate-3-phosphate synthase
MSLAVAAVKYGGELAGAEAVAKSYPSFFEVLQALNVKLVKL